MDFDVIVYILSFLKRAQLRNVACVSKWLRDIVYSDAVWSDRVKNRTLEDGNLFIPALGIDISVPIPFYVKSQKKISQRTRYARMMYWFYKKELGKYDNRCFKYPLSLSIRRNRMIEALEKSGCIPEYWTRERPSRKRKREEKIKAHKQ